MPKVEQEPLNEPQSPLETFIEPELEEPASKAPVEDEKKPESVEDLGTKLLERLFNKPPTND